MNIYESRTYMADLETAINQIAGNKEMKNSSFLITGATGTIGSFLIDLLIHNNRINHTEIKIYAVGRSIDRLSKRFDPVKTEQLVYVEYNCSKIVHQKSYVLLYHTLSICKSKVFL